MSDGRIKSILYVSSVDISLPNGPGVNEREFVLELLGRTDLQAHAVLPRPRSNVKELPEGSCTFVAGRKSRGLGLLKQNWSFYQACTAAVRDRQFDLIVARLAVMPVGIATFLLRTKVPYVIKTLGGGVIDGVALRESLAPVVADGVLSINRRFVGPVVERAIVIDACTAQLTQRTLESFDVPAERVLCIENATNTQRFQPRDAKQARRALGMPEDGPVIGFVGGRPWERGGLEMIRVAPSIIEHHPGARFVVVGGGTGMSGLIAEAEAAGLKDRFTFPGVVPYDQVAGYINTFDVGVSLDKPGRDHVVGNSFQKVRQYLASGVPVVSHEPSDIDLDTLGLGTAIAAGDLERFSQALLRWLGISAAERRELQRTAHAFAEEHLSISSALNRRLDAWNAALANRRSSIPA